MSFWCLVRVVQPPCTTCTSYQYTPKRLLLRPLHDISYSRTRHLYSQKGGSKVEVKNSPPPLKTSLYKGIFVNLVEVEVNSIQFFWFYFLEIYSIARRGRTSIVGEENILGRSCAFQKLLVSFHLTMSNISWSNCFLIVMLWKKKLLVSRLLAPYYI